jgi:hypothetical protein
MNSIDSQKLPFIEAQTEIALYLGKILTNHTSFRDYINPLKRSGYCVYIYIYIYNINININIKDSAS